MTLIKRTKASSFFISIIFLIFILPDCFGEMILKSPGEKLNLTNFFILESEYHPGWYLTSDLSSVGFKPYLFNSLPVTLKGIRRMYTFRGNFYIDPSLQNTPFSLYLGPSSYPYDIYLNGKKILIRGNPGIFYQSTFYDTIDIQINGEFLHYGKIPNEIAVQAYTIDETAPLEAPVFSSEKMIARMVFFRNLFNVYFIQASCVIGILIGLYFLFHFAARRFKDNHYLYFALMCFFFSFSYFNNAFTYISADEILFEKISCFSFPFTVLFLTLFIREFTKLAKKFWIIIILCIPPVLSAVYILQQKTKSSIDSFFYSIMTNFYFTPLLLFCLILLIISYIKKRKKEYFIILAGFIINIGASIHDMIFVMSSATPFCWLVPYSYMMLVISIFIVLAIEESSIYTESLKSADEISHKNKSMKEILQKIELVSGNLVHSSRNLEDNIGTAISVIMNSSKNNKAISGQLISQLQEIEKVTSQIALRMETAVDKIPKAISNQTAVVEETNRTVTSMNTHIDKIQQSTIQTNDIAQELSRIATDSKDIVLKSKNSISQVAENSKFISEVLQNIQEIVEESNFLSINASIESAHAGEAGKGFSILANEIRELANKSRERLEMSQSRLKQMISFINESLMLSEQVTNQLLTIIENTQSSAAMISNITALMNEHKAESNAILEGSGILLKDTLSIKNMTDDDQRENEKLQKTLLSLKKSFEDMANLLRGQTESESDIRDAIDHIKEVLTENLKTIDILKETVMIAADNKSA